MNINLKLTESEINFDVLNQLIKSSQIPEFQDINEFIEFAELNHDKYQLKITEESFLLYCKKLHIIVFELKSERCKGIYNQYLKAIE